MKDNGKGMTKDQLINLMRLGYHKASDDFNPSGYDTFYPLYLSSNLGRFGVGLKNAGFFLGAELAVRTKTKGDPFVWEISTSTVCTLK